MSTEEAAPTDASAASSPIATREAGENAASYVAREKEFNLPLNLAKGDVSIAPTDASVAGSSVAATEAEEDAASYVDASFPNANQVVLTNIVIEEADDEDVAPMHLHVLRAPAKLKGTAPVMTGSGRRSRSSSRSRPGSRRNSNSPNRGVSSPSGGSLKPSLGDAASLASSIEEDVDPDILLDKFGFQDLDPKLTQEDFQELLKKHMSGSNSLPTLNERMSEETMEDVHAFQDLVFVKKNKGSSGTASPSSGGQSSESDDTARDVENRASLTNFSGLAALNEEEEDEDDDENAGNDRSDVDPSPASSISGGNINLAESDLHHEEGGDIVVELPDPSRIQKEHDTAAAKQDISVMAVEDKSDNEELNLADDEAVDLPTSVIEELRISDECRLKGQSRDIDTTEGEYMEDR